MMVQRFITVLFLVVLVGSVGAEDSKEVVIASAKELKGIRLRRSSGRRTGPRWC